MSGTKKQVVLISASPKTDQEWAVSAFLAQRGESLLRDDSVEVQTIPVRQALLRRESEQAYRAMQAADAIVLIFPLYFFCMPAMLTRFLQDFASQHPYAESAVNVYAIVNCGFPEPEINREAIRVVESFSRQTGRVFRGGVLIGCGGMIVGAQRAPFMRPVFAQIDGLFARVKDEFLAPVQDEPLVSLTTVAFPRMLYFVAGNAGWRSQARKNGLRSKDLLRTPYRD